MGLMHSACQHAASRKLSSSIPHHFQTAVHFSGSGPVVCNVHDDISDGLQLALKNRSAAINEARANRLTRLRRDDLILDHTTQSRSFLASAACVRSNFGCTLVAHKGKSGCKDRGREARSDLRCPQRRMGNRLEGELPRRSASSLLKKSTALRDRMDAIPKLRRKSLFCEPGGALLRPWRG